MPPESSAAPSRPPASPPASPAVRSPGLAEWLALHGLTVATLAPLLAPQAGPAVEQAASDPPLPNPATPPDVAARITRAAPRLAPVLDLMLARTRFDLDPDRLRFPRAFTLHDDGTGRPFVSCPRDGRAGDLLRLAHEIGHACQIVACPGAALPPVLRETAAYVAEGLLVAGALADRDPLAPALAARHGADSRVIATRDAARLRAALAAVATDPPYSYRWNYPLARRIALAALADWPPADMAALVIAPPPLADLLARLPP